MAFTPGGGEGRLTPFSEACWPGYLNWTNVELNLEWTALICWIMNPIQIVFFLSIKKAKFKSLKSSLVKQVQIGIQTKSEVTKGNRKASYL